MSQVYERTGEGDYPVSLKEMKRALKIPDTSKTDDAFVQLLLGVATDFAESWTRRDVRTNTWTLTLDAFEDRLCLRRDKVESITDIVYQVVASPTTVDAAVYYLKAQVDTSLVILADGQVWPVDGDEGTKEGTIVVTFVTTARPQFLNAAKLGIIRHVTYLYQNRGDDAPATAVDGARRSGAITLYNTWRVSRF